MARAFADASSQYLSLGSSPVSDVPFALAIWFYHTEAENDDFFGVGADFVDYHEIYITSAHIVSVRSDDGTIGNATSTAGGAINTWHHACGLFVSDTDRRAFLDGGNKGTDATNVNPENLAHTAIGGRADSAITGVYSGYAAEAAIWDLSAWPGATASDKADEFERVAVPALAQGFSPLFFQLGLVAYWPLIRDEDQDRVGGYDLTPSNNPTVVAHPPVIYPVSPNIGRGDGICTTTVTVTETATVTATAQQ